MKRILALFCALTLLLALCACTRQETPQTQDTPEETTPAVSGTADAENEQTENTETTPVDASETAPVGETVGGETDVASPAPAQDDPLRGRWILAPTFGFETLETFGMTGYSIYTLDGHYGIVNMRGDGIGALSYSRLFYCPKHGLSSPDVASVFELTEDLTLSPDCGYDPKDASSVTYVFDNTRDRLYATAVSEGFLMIRDITDLRDTLSQDAYIAVLYDCDADFMMYADCGMRDLEEVYRGENREMRYGVLDKDLDLVVAFLYEDIRDGNDCYLVKKDGKYGYRALSGREYYPCVFEEANTCFRGQAWVKYGGKWGTVRF